MLMVRARAANARTALLVSVIQRHCSPTVAVAEPQVEGLEREIWVRGHQDTSLVRLCQSEQHRLSDHFCFAPYYVASVVEF
jgi:hypothetical protein